MKGYSTITFLLKDTVGNNPDGYDQLKQTYHYNYDTGNDRVKE